MLTDTLDLDDLDLDIPGLYALDLPEPSPAEMAVINTGLREWEASDNPHARRVARQYRDLTRDTGRAMEVLARMGNPLQKLGKL